MNDDRRALRAHEDWIGLVQPTGLVVSPAALLTAGAFVSKDVLLQQQALQRLVDASTGADVHRVAHVDDFRAFAGAVLDWAESDLVDDADALAAVAVPLHEYGETLRVSFVVLAPPDAEGVVPEKPLLLVKVLPTGTDFDDAKVFEERQWKASAHGRFERILRESEVPIGILWNGEALRLVYLPKGEISGHMTFPVAALLEVANRPMLSALRLLLGAERLFTLPEKQRLPALLAQSRKVQNQVSTALSEQFLVALAELLRGFQAADVASHGQLLHDFRAGRGYGDVYGGLLSVLLRLVFVLYAEDRGLLPDDEVFREGYSVRRLHERLRDDADAHPDTMDQRYGAWGQLLALFRLIHSGASWTTNGATVTLPAREGRLFHPDSAPFLEGRALTHRLQQGERLPPPRVSDGVVLRVLESLLLLDGQRLSYRTLDVEQIGSVYEGLMGFTIDVAEGHSVAVLPHHVVVDLDALLAKKPAERAAVFDEVKCKLTPKQQAELKAAGNVDDVLRALGSKRSSRMPLLVPGSLYLQPTDERRRSGSHYTPRALTEPIVATALRPILERLDAEAKQAGKPGITPEQILELKLCDPAMGSGAFLVQAGRQLGAHLVDAWARTNTTPRHIPPDETPLLHATRLVATRCLYGVDKNPLAVELAKLSLWLDTLAKDHPFTFLDHSLREGDSLVGLSVRNLRCFSWKPDAPLMFTSAKIDSALIRAQAIREELERLGDSGDDGQKRAMHQRAEAALADLRLIGDACIAAFFSSTKEKEQKEARLRFLAMVQALLERDERVILQSAVDEVLQEARGLKPFHWEIEFPEVFQRHHGGFDVFVGNPPFIGGRKVSEGAGEEVTSWLTSRFSSSGGADIVAYFFRIGFDYLRDGGTLGLLSTNSVAQGETRQAGLSQIAANHGRIYSANRRVSWPGQAKVVVCTVHIIKSKTATVVPILNGTRCRRISAFLFPMGPDDTPQGLTRNRSKSFQGAIILGMGFTFDDSNPKATPIAEKIAIDRGDPLSASVIFPYLGGEEVNSSPVHSSHRFVINFGEMDEATARKHHSAFRIVSSKVRPERASKDARKYPRMVNEWWKFWNSRPELEAAKSGLARVLVCSRHQPHWSCTFVSSKTVFSEALVVFAFDDYASFAILQSRIHESWARFLSSSMKDDLRYSQSDAFETFPFPMTRSLGNAGAQVGEAYFGLRARLMHANNEGMTATYNRFHDPDHDGTGVEGRDPRDVIRDIETLRTLHDEMDRAVLDAYGWTDIRPTCEFILDYEEDDDEDEAEAGKKKKKKKKPWRYRWPDDVRDEVLARLLELNMKYAEEEKAQHEESALDRRVDKDVAFALSAPLPTTKPVAKKKPVK
jgi:hypothetical protein